MKRTLFLSLMILCFSLFSEDGFKLTVSEKNGKIIDEIITTIYENNVLTLGFKQGQLRKLGDKIHGTGPLQFLAYIFHDPKLGSYMHSIEKSSFKFNGIVDGMAKNLNQMQKDGKLQKELPGFAKFVETPLNPLEKEAKDENWREFVRIIVKNNPNSQKKPKS